MRALLLVLALIPAVALAGERDPAKAPVTPPPAKPACKLPAIEHAVARDAAPTIKRLDQEPLANQYLGVMHIEDGCDKPIKIRDDVGAGRSDQR